MLGDIFEILVAVGGYLVADDVSKKHTGKHLHEHAFEWWLKIKEKIAGWLKAGTENKVTIACLGLLHKIDSLFIEVHKRLPSSKEERQNFMKGKSLQDKVKIKVRGFEKKQTTGKKITDEEVPLSELLQQFPDLLEKQEVVLMAQN